MKNNKTAKVIILLLIFLFIGASPVLAEDEEPLILTVEPDPDCLLSEEGDMTFFRFTVKNPLEIEYELIDLTLQGDLLEEPKLISEHIVIGANDVLEFTLENVHIDEDEFDMELSFWITWKTISFLEEDEDNQNPIVAEHVVAAPTRVEQFVEPVMGIICSPDVMLAREGDIITVTYTLVNDTKFDMTNITLIDPGIPQPAVSLDKNILNAGETMVGSVSFSMGTGSLELNPVVQYTVRGIESSSSLEHSVAVEYVDIDLRMEVEKYPASAEGTLFKITLANDGSHVMSDIRILDEIGTLISEGITLQAEEERAVSFTVPSAVASGSLRYISFEATGFDCLGGSVTVKSPSAYELLPFVESDQIRLKLSVSLASSSQNDDGSNLLKLQFEIRNDSLVPITNAVITEGDFFKSIVNEYQSLSTGTTTFEKEFIIPAGTRSLTFVLTALDPAQTQYASVPITLDLSPLTAPKPTNIPGIKPGKTVDITGTIYDTERYTKLFRMASLIVFALSLMFLLLSVIFRVAEMNIRRVIPKESTIRPFGLRKTSANLIPVKDTGAVHEQFGYVQPAKLRYMDRTDKLPVVGHDEAVPDTPMLVQQPVSVNTATHSLAGITSNTNSSRRKEGDITAVTIHKLRSRPVMISSDNTLPFPPVHKEKDKDIVDDINPAVPIQTGEESLLFAAPRIVEANPVPRIVPQRKLEIICVSSHHDKELYL